MEEKKENGRFKDDLKMTRKELAAYLRTLPENFFLKISFEDEEEEDG